MPDILRKRHHLFLLLLLFLLSCNKANNLPEPERYPVRFSSMIVGNGMLRASGTNWDNGDRIGIFAIVHQSALQPGNIIDNNDNLPFTTTGDGVFYPQSKSIFYPQDGSSMDFIAYYPYKNSLVNYHYPIDITEQSDFFYSNNLQDIRKDNSQDNILQFKRPLSKITFIVTPNAEGASLDGLTVSVEGLKTSASFSLSEGELVIDEQSTGTLNLNVTGNNDQKQATAIILPSDKGNEMAVQFRLGDKAYTWLIPHALEPGKVYSYDIKLDGLSPEVTPSSGYMEIPVYSISGTAPNSMSAMHLVGSTGWLSPDYTYESGTIRNYTVLFDTENRVPYWVAYPMHPMYLGSAGRTNDWNYDPLIPQTAQPNLSGSWSSSSLDRGHLLASADRNASSALNRPTFYYSNMAPQNSTMNGGTWAALEEQVRNWCKQSAYDTLYVVTGCILPELPEQPEYAYDVDGERSVIPKYLYKALLRKHKTSGTYYSIAFKMENEATGISYSDSRSIISIAELEQETGFTFFPGLPTDVAATIKQNKSLSSGWN